MWNSGVSGLFTYFGWPSPRMRPPKAITRPRAVADREHHAVEEEVDRRAAGLVLASAARPRPAASAVDALAASGRRRARRGPRRDQPRPKRADRLVGQAAAAEIGERRRALRQEQAAREGACGAGSATACRSRARAPRARRPRAWAAAPPGRPRRPAARPPRGSRAPSVVHDEADGIAMRAAAEAVVEALVVVDVEARRLLAVEGAAALPVAADAAPAAPARPISARRAGAGRGARRGRLRGRPWARASAAQRRLHQRPGLGHVERRAVLAPSARPSPCPCP